ncbi:MAG: hypothetical protein J6386_07645 [Candidatus Synoicihabitans palmerolidicus]|nr:hypothetical protein [Candidatus Synoicihabitans palmerolidicus]
MNKMRQQYNFHTLAAADVLRTSQRPKVEVCDHYLFAVMRKMRMEDGHLKQKQVSVFLFEHTVITFQEVPADVCGADQGSTKSRRREATYVLDFLLILCAA